MDIVVGSDDDLFGKYLADRLETDFIAFRKGYYQDGSGAPRILADYEDIEGKEVLVAYRRKQRPTKETIALHLENLYDVVENLASEKTYNAEAVDVLLPYFHFSRADHNPKTDKDEWVRKRDRGKGIGYIRVAKTLKGLGARRILTLNPHFHRKFKGIDIEDVEGIPVVCISGARALAEYVKKHNNLENVYIMSPDFNSSTLLEEFCEYLGVEPGISQDKKRLDEENTLRKGDVPDVGGRDVLIVDDEVNTLGTVIGTAKDMKTKGNAGKISVIAVHPVLPEKGFDRAGSLTSVKDGLIYSIAAANTINSDFGLEIEIYDEIKDFYRREKEFFPD